MMPQRHFQEDLEKLKSTLVGMAGLAEDAVRSAVDALLTRDPQKAADVIKGDAELDAIEIELEDQAINLLALHQPMAGDLRLIAMAMKISSDLERVGDHGVNIAEGVGWLIEAAPFPVIPEIEEMVRVAIDMLADSLDAFVRGDSGLAREVL